MAAVEEPCESSASWMSRVSDTYNLLWRMVIRPPRDLYTAEELGPSRFRLGKRIYERHDLALEGGRGRLECSHFVPAKMPQAQRPCVVYLHGNCSSRLEAFDVLPVLLPRDMTVFCLDLSGSGRSDGTYISLGYHEEKDLCIVLEHLRTLPFVSSIGLWGRSMGATTSIMRAGQDTDLAACVLDSAFCDLKTVAEELVARGRFPLPSFLVAWALDIVRTEVESRAAFNPLELTPVKSAPSATCPAFFGVASDDAFVLPHHTQDIHSAWGGERVLRVFDGGHNGVRPGWFLEEAADFLLDRLQAWAIASHPLEHTADSAPSSQVQSTPYEESLESEECCSTPPRQLGEDTETYGPVPLALLDGKVPKHKLGLALELLRTGFGKTSAGLDLVVEAAQTCCSVEDAVQWLLGRAAQAPSLVENEPPVGRRGRTLSPAGLSPEGEEFNTPGSAQPSSAFPARVPSTPSITADKGKPEEAQVGPPGATLNQQLLYLGFEASSSEAAARRCLSLEAAMEWLGARQITVRL